MANIRVSLLLPLLVMVAVVYVQGGLPVAAKANCCRQTRRHKFRVYLHDSLNVTDVLVVKPRTGPITTTTAPFGTLFCVNDPITTGPEMNSALLGSVSGLFSVISLDGLSTFFTLTLAFNNTLQTHSAIPASLRGLFGTVNSMGILDLSSTQPSRFGIAGGTGSFLLAQGSASLAPVDTRTFQTVFSIDLDLYLQD